jgi:hypothetical protein
MAVPVVLAISLVGVGVVAEVAGGVVVLLCWLTLLSSQATHPTYRAGPVGLAGLGFLRTPTALPVHPAATGLC